jgi:hypothetical protein
MPVYYISVNSNIATLSDESAATEASKIRTIRPEPKILSHGESGGTISLVRVRPDEAYWPSALMEDDLPEMPEPAVSSVENDEAEVDEELAEDLATDKALDEALDLWNEWVDELHESKGQQGFIEWLLTIAPYLSTPFIIQAASFDSSGDFYFATEWTVRPAATEVEVKKIEMLENSQDEGPAEAEQAS